MNILIAEKPNLKTNSLKQRIESNSLYKAEICPEIGLTLKKLLVGNIKLIFVDINSIYSGYLLAIANNIKQRGLETKIVCWYDENCTNATITTCLKLDIKLFCPQNVNSQYLADLILKSSLYGCYLPNEIYDYFKARTIENSQEISLTNKELLVLKQIVQKEKNASIAESLQLSISTVRTHIKNLNRKLNTNQRSKLIERAIELKLI